MIATRLKELRIEKGYTIEYISKQFDVSKVTFYRYESGERNPNACTICKLSDFFDVSLDYLLGKTNDRKPIAIDVPIIDIKNKIDNIICELEDNKPLLFDGELLSKDANLSLVVALKIGLSLVDKYQKKLK